MAEEEVKVADAESKKTSENPTAAVDLNQAKQNPDANPSTEPSKEANGTDAEAEGDAAAGADATATAEVPADVTAEATAEVKQVEDPAQEENGNDQNRDDKAQSKPKDGADDEERSERKSKFDRNDRSDSRREKNYRPKTSYRENIKFDPSVREESDDPEEIRKQVEFYFSDSNILQDKFLFNQIGGSENRPLPISVIHGFKRMRRFQPLSAVIAALKESEILEVINDDEVKRKEPLADGVGTNFEDIDLTIFEDAAMPRTLYAKGFGKETATTQYDIESFFEPYGPIKAVRLRRTDEKLFKSSVFVEFEDEETMQAFMELDPKPTWNDEKLKIMTKKEYCEMKVEDIKAGRIQANNRNDRDGRGYRGSSRGYRGKDRGKDRGRDYIRGRRNDYRDPDDDKRNEDDWKGRRDDFQRRGFKDRGDRRKDDRSRKNKKDDEVKEEQEYHENGVPKVKGSSLSPNKRAREEENDEGPTAKKSKPEAEAEA